MFRGMAKPRKRGRKTRNKPPSITLKPGWHKWTTALPPATVLSLKVRAAQERRPMCDVLDAAIASYLKTAVPV